MTGADFGALDRAGLNLQAVFDLGQLPADRVAELRKHFDPAARYRQLILIGHGGRRLWEAVGESGIGGEHPIDEFSTSTATQWFAAQFPGRRCEIVYPGSFPVGLQALGTLAGWHHASPFMVGINEAWGTWYAYRVVLLADTDLPPSPPMTGESPCLSCGDKACVASCPAAALDGAGFSLEKCSSYRRAAGSRCATSCVARIRCPVASGHRYDDEQIRHSYSKSLNYLGKPAS